jgi:hypothetical protein
MRQPLIGPVVVQKVGQIFAFELALKRAAIGQELRRNIGELRPVGGRENFAGNGEQIVHQKMECRQHPLTMNRKEFPGKIKNGLKLATHKIIKYNVHLRNYFLFS